MTIANHKNKPVMLSPRGQNFGLGLRLKDLASASALKI